MQYYCSIFAFFVFLTVFFKKNTKTKKKLKKIQKRKIQKHIRVLCFLQFFKNIQKNTSKKNATEIQQKYNIQK